MNDLPLSYEKCTSFYPVTFSKRNSVVQCHYEFPSTQIKIDYVDNKLNNDSFGVLFRIKEWTQTRLTPVLVPEMRDGDGFLSIYIKESILVALPALSVLDDSHYPDTFILADFDDTDFGVDEYHIYFYSGTGPAKTIASKYLLLDTIIAQGVRAHTSAVSIVNVDKEKVLPVSIQFNPKHEEILSLDDSEEDLISSIGFPWVFDEFSDYESCSIETLNLRNQKVDHNFDVEIREIRGGFLNFTTNSLYDGDTVYNFSSENNGDYQSFVARSFVATFCPDLQAPAPRGYWLRTVNYSQAPTKTPPNCYLYVLNESMPYAVVNSDHGFRSGIWCYEVSIPGDSVLLIDFCDPSEPPETRFTIDGQAPDSEDCANRIDLTFKVYTCCRLRKEKLKKNSLILYIKDAFFNSAILFRLFKEDEDANMIVTGQREGNETITIPLDPSKDTIVFLTFPLSELNYQKLDLKLEYIRWTHGARECEYDLYPGAVYPPKAQDQRLITFRDSEPFIRQFLSSATYSLWIPRGCQPSLLTKSEAGDRDPIEQCKGQALGHGPDFGDPRHDPQDAFQLYEIVWFCAAFPVDVLIEFIAMHSGGLQITVFDGSGATSDSLGISYKNATTQNLTYAAVSRIRVDWINNFVVEAGQPDGFFFRVHFNRSIPLLNGPYTTTLEPKISARISKIFLLFLLPFIV